MPIRHTYRPHLYFGLAFLATFLFWGLGARMSFSEAYGRYYMLVMLLGLMTPFLISTAMILGSDDRRLKRRFSQRLFNLRLMRPATFPFLILVMPIIVLISALLSLLIGEPITQFQPTAGFSFSSGFIPVLLLILLASLFEELGWRGYAFDSLESRFNFFTAALIFGLLWALWYLPLFFVKGSYQYEIMRQNPLFALNFLVSIVPLGILISWVWAKNRRSIPAAILFHCIVNLSQETLAISQVTKIIETLVLTLVVAGLVYSDREFFFGPKIDA